MSSVKKGVVKWFNNAKGFGFIEHESGKDVFVHYSVILDDGYKSLKDGEEVEYEITEGPKGFHATKVVRVNSPKKDDDVTENASLASKIETEASDADSSEDSSTISNPGINNPASADSNGDSVQK
mgnify:CR=1 FL=1